MMTRGRQIDFYLLFWAILLASAATVILLARPLSARHTKPRPTLDLRVADQNGRMRIDWDASDPAIQGAQGATLEVEDGGVLNRYPVEANVLRSGGLDYVRRSDDVFLTLTLYQDGHPGAQSSVRRIAPIQLQLASTPAPAVERTQPSSRTRKR